MSLSFVAFVFAMLNTSVANVVFIISTQTMFLALFGYFYLNEKISAISFASIILAMSGIIIMIGDSFNEGTLFGNLVALVIPICFSVLVMVVRKNSNLDMVPAVWYASIFSILYGVLMTNTFSFSYNDILMGSLLGIPQLTFGFVCITIGSRTTTSATIGLLMLTETLFGPIWVWLFLNEVPPLSVFIGGLIIISAIISNCITTVFLLINFHIMSELVRSHTFASDASDVRAGVNLYSLDRYRPDDPYFVQKHGTGRIRGAINQAV